MLLLHDFIVIFFRQTFETLFANLLNSLMLQPVVDVSVAVLIEVTRALRCCCAVIRA